MWGIGSLFFPMTMQMPRKRTPANFLQLYIYLPVPLSAVECSTPPPPPPMSVQHLPVPQWHASASTNEIAAAPSPDVGTPPMAARDQRRFEHNTRDARVAF